MTRRKSDEVTAISAAPIRSPSKENKRERFACLIMLTGTSVGQVYQLNKNLIRIGRADNADIQLMDSGISRNHAEIEKLRDGSFRISDAGSRNGTFANNRKIEGAIPLKDGDKIQVGVQTVLKFSYGDDLEANYAQKMYDAALRDDLTGVYNRRYLDERLHSEFSYAQRKELNLGLLLIDLDHFKLVNDNYGHVVGDQVLRAIAKKIEETIRAEDVLARYGGEEFCVLCRDTELMKATVLAERIRHAVASMSHMTPQGAITTTVSIGVVALPDSGIVSAKDLLDNADEALYKAKASGRNCVITRRPRNKKHL